MTKRKNHRSSTQTTHETSLTGYFSHFAHATSLWTGHPATFLLAVAVVLAWVVTGPFFNYSDTWQLVINTGTTIVTFLMVFLIQNTQNRDAKAIHLKLDELIRSVEGARDELVDLEDLSDDDLQKLQKQFEQLRKEQGDEIEDHVEKHIDALEDELEDRGVKA